MQLRTLMGPELPALENILRRGAAIVLEARLMDSLFEGFCGHGLFRFFQSVKVREEGVDKTRDAQHVLARPVDKVEVRLLNVDDTRIIWVRVLELEIHLFARRKV